MKKKILIFGPIGDFGGREIEAGFIAGILSDDYTVDVLSTSEITSRSQVFQFNSKLKVFSLKQLLYKSSLLLRILAIISFVRNKKAKNKQEYVSNNFAKKLVNYNMLADKAISDTILNYDLLFICAQLSSLFVPNAIAFANKHNIKIIFRTTGTIAISGGLDYIKLVNLYIHHSENNAGNLTKYHKHQYEIVDQCSFVENELLKIKPVQNIIKFLILARLSPEKGIEQAIEFFLNAGIDNTLTVVGNGELKLGLVKKYAGNPQVIFADFVQNDEIDAVFDAHDCVIISSFEESGPLVGIEAMASARLILSTKVGAMPYRLRNINGDFWFDIDDEASFHNAIHYILNLPESMIHDISGNIRDEYINNYSMNKIGTKYKSIVASILEKQ